MDQQGREAAEDRLRSLEEQLAQKEDQYLRALAELDNYRKRAEREREEVEKRAKKTVLLDVLDVADTLELAVRHEGNDSAPLQEGVRAIHQQLVDILRKNGARPFDPVGRPFDPNYHEAVGVMESEFFPPGVVGLEIKKGYLLDGELLRPSRVHVVKES